MLNNSMMGLIGDLKSMAPLDLPVPEEILDIVVAYLVEQDLKNLIKVGDERIKQCANRRLEKYLLLKGK